MSIRAIVPLALAAGLVGTAPAVAGAKAPAKAHAAGGDAVVLTYPSLVNVRVKRTYRALDKATRRIENNKTDKAATALKTVRRQAAAAWRGARYVIRTTPPPPAEEARVRARKSGGAPVGPTLAGPADTAVLVLTLQHDIVGEMVGVIDGSHGTGLNAISRTLNFIDDRRDQALAYIKSVAPPPPPDAEDARVRARTAGDAPVVNDFPTVMPNLIPQFDDELQAIEGTKSDATDLTNGGRRLLNDAADQIERSRAFVNTNWPPVPAED